MRAIVTVIGKDRVGISAEVCTMLAQHKVNILDISQTILQEYFTMIMLVDAAQCDLPFSEFSTMMRKQGDETSLDIRVQREELFQAMHRI